MPNSPLLLSMVSTEVQVTTIASSIAFRASPTREPEELINEHQHHHHDNHHHHSQDQNHHHHNHHHHQHHHQHHQHQQQQQQQHHHQPQNYSHHQQPLLYLHHSSHLNYNNDQQSSSSQQDNNLVQQQSSRLSTSLESAMTFARENFVQHIEAHLDNYIILSVLLVISIYFLYYFLIISQRPRLITNNGSKFSQFVKENFNHLLNRRFYPIFFFWGSNFQTALFGYMQGTESELPREEFIRQYLDVSDEQYYQSNVNLEQYFKADIVPKPSKFALANNKGSPINNVEDEQKHQRQQYRQNLVNDSESKVDYIKLDHRNDQSKQQQQQQTPHCFPNVILKPLGTNLQIIYAKSCDLSKMKAARHHELHDDEGQSMINNNNNNELATTTSASVSSSLSSSVSSVQDDSGIVTERSFVYRPSKLSGSPSENSCHSVDSNRLEKFTTASSTSNFSPSSSSYDNKFELNYQNYHEAGISEEAIKYHHTMSKRRSKTPTSSSVELEVGTEAKVAEANLGSSQYQDKKRKHYYHEDITRQATNRNNNMISPSLSLSSSSTSSSSSSFNISGDEACQIEINSSCLSDSCGCMLNLSTQKHNYIEYGRCALDWYKPSHKNYHDNKLVGLISAGMTTGSDKIYVTETVKCLTDLGYEVCVFIRRGVGGLTLKSARFFSPTKWKDFETAIESIQLQRPNAKIVAVGFSFGAIELCRYLSMTGKDSLVNAAMLISCPYNPEVGGRNMRKTFLNRLMDTYLANYLGKLLYLPQKNRSILENSRHQLDFSVLPKLKSLYDFEDHFNRVVQYYPTTEAYAKDSTLIDCIKNIQVPTLCLSSSDDFMATESMLPLKQLASHDKMAMILTKRGGHMAFVDGLWPRAPFLGQRVLYRYFKAMRHSSYLEHHPTKCKINQSSEIDNISLTK